jgi:hypothetical protein
MPDPVNGERVALSMAESRGSDSDVKLNDIRINQMSSPMYSLCTIKDAILTSRGVKLYEKQLTITK